MSEQRKIPRDRYGNRFYEVGDLVTRDGTDIHRVVDHNGSDGHAPDGMTVVCVKAPSEPWTEVGEEEFNVCRRYEPVGEEDERPVVSFAEMLASHRLDYDSHRQRMQQIVVAPLWQKLFGEAMAQQARSEAMRPAIGKPLSRRARRRNRGRVHAAKAVMMRGIQPAASWSWPVPDFASNEHDPVAWTQEVELGDRRYRTEFTPYLLDLMKELGDKAVERTVIYMPSRVGFTRSVMDGGTP